MPELSRLPEKERDDSYGGEWTVQKLNVVADYLGSYLTALSKQRFRKCYIDAFAGRGYVKLRETRMSHGLSEQCLLFHELADEEIQTVLAGSARRALEIKRPFDEYIFIDKSKECCAELMRLKEQYPERNVSIICDEANSSVTNLCKTTWHWQRAVMFLDPFALEVDWATVKAIAKTKAVDLWLWFPIGSVNRLFKKDGRIPVAWRTCLNRILGTNKWYEELYSVESDPVLFETDSDRVEKASVEVIGRYFIDRLKSVFPPNGVAKPGVFRNSKNCPIFLLCFAAANENGADIAINIANHLLRGLH